MGHFSFLIGDECETDFDGCADSPCASWTGAVCADIAAADQQDFTYNCTNCPDGYTSLSSGGPCLGQSYPTEICI